MFNPYDIVEPLDRDWEEEYQEYLDSRVVDPCEDELAVMIERYHDPRN